MKIGVDIDGVIIDFEERLRYKAEMYDFWERKNKKIMKNDVYWVQDKYGWSENEWNEFYDKYIFQLTKESQLRPGAKEVLNLLKQEGHELIIITTRGIKVDGTIDVIKGLLDSTGIKFDRIHWSQIDKLQACKDEKLDVMIDDNPNICENLSQNKIETFYFRNIYGKKLEENEYLKEVYDWANIYNNLKMINNIGN